MKRVDVGRRGAVADGVREAGSSDCCATSARMLRLVAAVLLLERAEHVVHRLADVVPEGDAVAEDVGHELAGAEALAMPSAPPTQKAGIMPTKIAFEWKSGMQA